MEDREKSHRSAAWAACFTGWTWNALSGWNAFVAFDTCVPLQNSWHQYAVLVAGPKLFKCMPDLGSILARNCGINLASYDTDPVCTGFLQEQRVCGCTATPTSVNQLI